MSIWILVFKRYKFDNTTNLNWNKSFGGKKKVAKETAESSSQHGHSSSLCQNDIKKNIKWKITKKPKKAINMNAK